MVALTPRVSPGFGVAVVYGCGEIKAVSPGVVRHLASCSTPCAPPPSTVSGKLPLTVAPTKPAMGTDRLVTVGVTVMCTCLVSLLDPIGVPTGTGGLMAVIENEVVLTPGIERPRSATLKLLPLAI